MGHISSLLNDWSTTLEKNESASSDKMILKKDLNLPLSGVSYIEGIVEDKYIENNEHEILPKEFIFSHNFCVNLYDLIFDTIKHDAFKDTYTTKFAIPNTDESINIDELKSNNADLLNWLKENKHDAIVKF